MRKEQKELLRHWVIINIFVKSLRAINMMNENIRLSSTIIRKIRSQELDLLLNNYVDSINDVAKKSIIANQIILLRSKLND